MQMFNFLAAMRMNFERIRDKQIDKRISLVARWANSGYRYDYWRLHDLYKRMLSHDQANGKSSVVGLTTYWLPIAGSLADFRTARYWCNGVNGSPATGR